MHTYTTINPYTGSYNILTIMGVVTKLETELTNGFSISTPMNRKQAATMLRNWHRDPLFDVKRWR